MSKTRKALLAVLALVAVCLILPSMALAYPLVDLNEIRVDNSAVASIHADGLGDLSAYAGNYILGISNPSGSSNPFVQVSGYCSEPTLAPIGTLQYELLPITKGTAFGAAAWILSQGYTGAMAPAAQAAVWELTWDTAKGNPYSLSDGNFKLYSGISATDVASIYNLAIAAEATFDPSGFVIANNPVGSTDWCYAQNYIIPNPSGVPIPPSALLLGTGLLGMVGLGWRRRQDKA